MAVTRFELDSTSSDDNVISVLRQLQREVIEKIDKDQGGGTGEAVVLLLRRTAAVRTAKGFSMPSVHQTEVDTFVEAVTEVAAEYAMSKRHTENTGLFSSATDRNDTEALRTLSVLALVAVDGVEESEKSWGGFCDAYTMALYVGLREAAVRVTREIVDEIIDREGALGAYNLLTAGRVLVSRHETRGWGWVLDVISCVLVERGLYLAEGVPDDDDGDGDGDGDSTGIFDAGDPPEPVADPVDPEHAD